MAGTRPSDDVELVARLGAGPRELRAKAAVALGQSGSGVARDVLERAIEDADPVVARRAIEALGRMGDATSLNRLREVLPPADAAGQRAHRLAGLLIAGRLGLEAPAGLGRRAAAAITGARTALLHAPPRKAVATRLDGDLARVAPGVPAAPEAGQLLDCRGAALAAIPTRLRRDAPTLLPVLVMKESPALRRFALHLLVIGVADGSSIRLAGFRPDGTEVLAGEADRRTGAFRLATAEGAAYPPIEIEGVLDDEGQLAFSRLDAGAWVAPAAAPRPDPGPNARP
jgi:hypothetical protein